MLIMIMKPHLRSMWEKNIEDLVRGKFPNSMVLRNQNFHFRRCRPMWSFKIASFRLHPAWGTNSDDPVVTITEVLPLPPSQTIGNVGVSTGARQPSLAKILSQIDAYLWLYITMITEGSPCILNTNDDDMFILTPLRPFISWKWPIVGFYPFVDATEGVSAITKEPLADVSVPEGDCVSGNEEIRYAGFITFT